MAADPAAGRLTAVGMMSGTSMDGIDVALIETDGEAVLRRGPGITVAYEPKDRDILAAAMRVARTASDWRDRPRELVEAEDVVTRGHAIALSDFFDRFGVSPSQVDVIGFHGQTVLHRPEQGLTVQLGDGARLAALSGVDVVFDFRAGDVAAGGQGAPLVPVYHRALAAGAGLEVPVAVVNIGGVANVTWIGPHGDMRAFDTGPGNALLDDWVRGKTGAPMDAGGKIAASGEVDGRALRQLLAHPYFELPPPKSLDRDDFCSDLVMDLSVEDGAATLTAFTAHAIARSLAHLPSPPRRWIVAGGGAKNPTLMRELGVRLPAPVETADALGWSAEYLEAEAFALLAVRSLQGKPLTFPGTTGVARPATGGRLAHPR